MTQPQQNPWDVVEHQFFSLEGYASYYLESGAPTEVDIKLRRYCTDRIKCTLRNGQIIRVRPKR